MRTRNENGPTLLQAVDLRRSKADLGAAIGCSAPPTRSAGRDTRRPNRRHGPPRLHRHDGGRATGQRQQPEPWPGPRPPRCKVKGGISIRSPTNTDSSTSHGPDVGPPKQCHRAWRGYRPAAAKYRRPLVTLPARAPVSWPASSRPLAFGVQVVGGEVVAQRGRGRVGLRCEHSSAPDRAVSVPACRWVRARPRRRGLGPPRRSGPGAPGRQRGRRRAPRYTRMRAARTARIQAGDRVREARSLPPRGISPLSSPIQPARLGLDMIGRWQMLGEHSG